VTTRYWCSDGEEPGLAAVVMVPAGWNQWGTDARRWGTVDELARRLAPPPAVIWVPLGNRPWP
jgi:hypothetical protein